MMSHDMWPPNSGSSVRKKKRNSVPIRIPNGHKVRSYGSYRIMSEAYNKTDKHFDERASSRGLLGGPFGGQCSTHEHQKTSDQF
jgi:hypothetical protein